MAGRSLRPDFCDMHDKLPFLKKSLNQCELEKLERYAKEKVDEEVVHMMNNLQITPKKRLSVRFAPIKQEDAKLYNPGKEKYYREVGEALLTKDAAEDDGNTICVVEMDLESGDQIRTFSWTYETTKLGQIRSADRLPFLANSEVRRELRRDSVANLHVYTMFRPSKDSKKGESYDFGSGKKCSSYWDLIRVFVAHYPKLHLYFHFAHNKRGNPKVARTTLLNDITELEFRKLVKKSKHGNEDCRLF